MSDFRVGLRSLRGAPIFFIASVLTLALGIALATAAYSLINTVLIRPLPFADADRVVMLSQQGTPQNLTGVSYPNFLDWQQQSVGGAFEGMAYVRGRGTVLQLPDGPRTVLTAFTSTGFFGVLRPTIALGRGFTVAEERAGDHVAVITHALWQERFGGDQAIVGRSISIAEGMFTIVGVLPRDVVMPEWAELYVPLTTIASTEHVLAARDFHADSRALARLKPGVTLARATVELNAIAARLATAYPAENRIWPAANLASLRDTLLGDGVAHIKILCGAMVLVLLLGWVNVTNLALVRATGRTRELAVRVSLGASRTQLIRQLLTEHLILAAVAGALGVGMAAAGVDLIRVLASDVVRADAASINLSALAFAFAVVLLTALAIGGLPALRGSRVDLTESLKDGGSGSGVSRSQQRIRSTLVVGEIALALTLVIVAGLLVQSYWRLSHVDPGFDTHHLVAIDVSPPGTRYAQPLQAGQYYRQVLEAVRAVPGVERAALTNHMPLNGAALPTSVQIPGRIADPATDPVVLFRTFSPEYPATLVIPVSQGRGFTDADLTSGDAVLVNERFAKTFWPGGNAIGKQVVLHKSAQGFADYGEPLPGTIVGVIGDVRHFGVARAPVAEIYVPYARNPWSHMVVVARAKDQAAALIPAMRKAILGVDPSTILTGGVFSGFVVIDDLRDGGVSAQRFTMELYGAFALCALLLAAIGIYGLMAYIVAKRTRELGIRMALGARAIDVVHLVLVASGRVIIVGVVIGLVAAIAATRLVASLLFGVTPTDVPTFAVTTAILGAVAMLASYLPARKASRVDPVVALRSE